VKLIILLESFGNLETGNLRQLDVHKDEVGPVLARKFERFHAVARLDRRVARSLNQVSEKLHIQLVVLNNHHLFGHVDPLLSVAALQVPLRDISFTIGESTLFLDRKASAIWLKKR
jgi:hypothetical protein